MEIIFAKKTVRNTEICKKQAQKQANFNQNKHKNKQLASLKKKPQIHRKTSPNSWENRKVGNTGVAPVAANHCHCGTVVDSKQLCF